MNDQGREPLTDAKSLNPKAQVVLACVADTHNTLWSGSLH